MQTDVSTVHLNSTGFAYIGRTRIKALIITSSGTTGGVVGVWDTLSALTTATYGQSTTTVTITSSAHGLSTGQRVGLSFSTASGVSATNGNYAITVTDANTFTITDINSRTIASSTACSYVANTANNNSTQWHASFDIPAFAGTTTILFPGEGILIEKALYMTLTATYITAVTAFYG